jgi:hypothetical protein
MCNPGLRRPAFVITELKAGGPFLTEIHSRYRSLRTDRAAVAFAQSLSSGGIGYMKNPLILTAAHNN